MYVTHPCFVSLPLSNTSIILSPTIAGDGKEFIGEISSKSKDQKIKTLCFILLPLDCVWSISTHPLRCKTIATLHCCTKIRPHYISKLCLIWFVLFNIMKVCCIYLFRVWSTLELITALNNDNDDDEAIIQPNSKRCFCLKCKYTNI